MPERVFGSGLRGTAIWDEDRPKTARPVPQILNLDDRKFHLDSRPLSTIFPLAKSLFQNHVFSFPKRTKRSHYLKKGQARSSIKILNKAKIILIIINGNVDFTIKSLRPCPVSTAPLTRPPIPSCCKL